MQKINWDKFKVKNEDSRKAFEELSYFLFCRRFRKSLGIFTYNNQTGIETEPIKVKGKLIGFQSKWFDTNIDEQQIVSSIIRAKGKNPGLNKIIFFINKPFTESPKKDKKKSQTEINIDDEAKKQNIDLEWIVPRNFDVILNLPSNLDLAQLYFDFSDELAFIKAFSKPEILTFLQSSEYVDLPFLNSKTEKVEDVTKQIIKLKQKLFLLSGHPGSGKSISFYRLAQIFSGLDQKKLDDSKKILQANKAIPMLINLKDCSLDTLENIIRQRQNDYGLRNSKLGFIYLLDGLDELSSERADHVLSYLFELEKSDSVSKIVISCRSGNLNKVKVKAYFKSIIEYKIHDLDSTHIDKYFQGKNNKDKKKLLGSLRKSNVKLCSDIKDILLANLLWETIESLDGQSTILDLLDKKIEILIKDHRYKKNIEELNLLNPKENKILELNKDISFKFQKKLQFRLPQKEIQEIILSKYPRIDYKAANEILNYIANLFFDGSSSPPPDKSEDIPTFVYQHRRYQDYFFIQYLADEYEKAPSVIRNLGVLSNRDFFENLLLPYLRKKYTKDRNLPGIVGLSLIDVYLGNRNDYGADDPYYQNSSEFIPSIASQDDEVFEGLLSDESLAIKSKVSLDIGELEAKFIKWEKDKENWRLRDYLLSMWNGGIPFLIQNMAIFWSHGKKEAASELRKTLNEIVNLFEKYKFRENLKEHDRLEDPFWARWEDNLYLRIVFKKDTARELFTKLIRPNYQNFENESYTIGRQEAGKDKLVKSFFRVLTKVDVNYLSEVVSELSEEEILMLIDVLVSEKNLPLLIRNTTIAQRIKLRIEGIKANNIKLIFCKKVFGLMITQEENEFIEKTRKKLREARRVDWHMDDTQNEYSLVSYILDENSFEEYLKPQTGHPFRYYDELGLYSAIFRDYVILLKGEKEIESIVRDYNRYINFYTEKISGNYLSVDTSFLWSFIFSNAKSDFQKLKNIKISLFTGNNNLILFSFAFNLQKINEKLFVKLIDRNDLINFEKDLDSWDDDAPSFVNRCFQIALFYARLDRQKSISYIAKGINDGMVRHGWHKDNIVSYLLVDSLEILWRNNWASNEELKQLTQKVYRLTKKVKQITDGAHTSRGPYYLIDMIAKYDLEFATELKEENDKIYDGRFAPNITLSSIMKGKILRGEVYENIEEEMKKYRKEYRYDGKPDSDYYESKIEIYLEIAQSDFYSPEEKKQAFESAYHQIEEMEKEGLDYYLADWEYKDLKKAYIKLCKIYGKKVNVKFEKKEEYKTVYKLKEKDFIKEINKARTKQKMIALLKKINDQVKLENPQSWRLIVEKTYKIFNNIKPFIDLLRENSFPHTDRFRTNSKNFHHGLAYALGNINTREEALNYLFDKTTGHAGFVNIMRSYEDIGDKQMCLKLFRHYLLMCDFLVN